MIDYQNANEVFDVYGVYPQSVGNAHRRLLGRFAILDGKLRIIEDHTGILHGSLFEGPVGPNIPTINSMDRSPYLEIVADADIQQGKHIGLVPQGEAPPEGAPAPQEPPEMVQHAPAPSEEFGMETPASEFEYMEPGMKQPQDIQIRG